MGMLKNIFGSPEKKTTTKYRKGKGGQQLFDGSATTGGEGKDGLVKDGSKKKPYRSNREFNRNAAGGIGPLTEDQRKTIKENQERVNKINAEIAIKVNEAAKLIFAKFNNFDDASTLSGENKKEIISMLPDNSKVKKVLVSVTEGFRPGDIENIPKINNVFSYIDKDDKEGRSYINALLNEERGPLYNFASSRRGKAVEKRQFIGRKNNGNWDIPSPLADTIFLKVILELKPKSE